MWVDLSGVREAIESTLGPEILDGSYATDVLPWLEPLDSLVSVSRVDGTVLIGTFALIFD